MPYHPDSPIRAGMRVSEALDLGLRELTEAGVPEPGPSAGLLLGHVLDREYAVLYAEPERELSPAEERRYRELLARRVLHEPVAYITGEREFWGRPFKVRPGVLVPRPETEGLVEAALKRVGRDDPVVADVGTGCGCIAVTLALELPSARIVATDASAEALEVARENAERHQVSDRVDLVYGSDLAPLGGLAGRVDLLVSNPPYVSEAEHAGLERQVRDWEPREALVAGPTGLEVIERLVAGAGGIVTPGGWLLLEVGYDQAASVRDLLAPGRVEVERDLAGIDRVVCGRIG